MLDLLRSMLALGIVSLASFGLGRPLLRKVRPDLTDPLSIFVWSAALGLAAAGTLLLLLAHGHVLYGEAVVLLSAPGCLWALLELACLPVGTVRRKLYTRDSAAEPPAPQSDWPAGAKVILAAAALAAAWALLVALAPPTSPEALARTLQTPKNLLLDHGLAAPTTTSPVATNIAQMWFLWALALDGPVAAALVQWGLGMLFALAVVLLARVFVPCRAAWLAGALVVLAPGVQRQLVVPLEDLAFALFGTLALECVARSVVRLETGRWALLGGTMLGTALAVQPGGLPLAAALGGALLYACRAGRELRGDVVRLAVQMGAVALVVAGPWLTQAMLAGSSAGGQSLHSAIVHIGPALIAALAGLPLARRLMGLDVLLLSLAAYVSLAVVLGGSVRWWSVAAGWASVAVCWVWLELQGLPRWSRRSALGLLGLMAIAGSATQFVGQFDAVAVAVGWQSRRDFLLAHEPTFRAAWLFNRIKRPGDRILIQDPRGLYFNGQAAFADGSEGSGSAGSATGDLSRMIAAARRGGFSYLLAAETLEHAQTPSGGQVDSTDRAVVPPPNYAELSPGGQVIPILEYCFADDKSRRIRYSLLKVR